MREVDQDSTPFPFKVSKNHPAKDTEPGQHVNFGFRDPFHEALNTGIAKLYQALDSISGHQSQRLPPRDIRVPIYDTFDYLKSEEIIRHIGWAEKRYNDAPAFYRFGIFPGFPDRATDGLKVAKAIGHGFGKDLPETLSKGLGEFLERYFLMLYKQRDLLRGSYATLRQRGFSALNPEELAGFSETQLAENPRRRFDERSTLSWQFAERVGTGERILIPAQLAHWNYIFVDDEPILRETNTNGAGGYFTKEGAVLSGLYELIQRDGFLIHWLNRITPARIDPDSVPDKEFQNVLGESRRYGFAIHCMDITSDLNVPNMAVAIVDEGNRWPRFALGAGCAANPLTALTRALVEAWSVYYWMRAKTAYELPDGFKPFSAEIGQDERLRLAANPAMQKNYEFLISGEMKPFGQFAFNYPHSFSTQRAELRFLVETIEKLGPGYEVYAYMATHPVLRELGYHSAHVLVPQLLPLYLRESMPLLGAGRLKEVPAKIGKEPAENFYSFPHPFP